MPGRDLEATHHLDFVDGLRAVAVLSVVFFHVTWHNRPMPSTPWVRISLNGAHGVELFFVISGFCLAYPTLAKIARGEPFTFAYVEFFAKRLTRIYPAYLVALAAFALLAFTNQWQMLAAHVPPRVPAASYSWSKTLQEVFFLAREPLHNGSFWTLAVEMHWYIVFPIMLALFVRSRLALIAAGVASWALAYASPLHSIDLLLFPGFFMGIFAAYLYVHPQRWLRWAPYVTAVLCFFEVSITPVKWSRTYGTTDIVWQFIALGVVLSAIQIAPLRAGLAWRPLVLIGAASYSIYLIHEPIIAWFDFVGLNGFLAGLIAVVCGIGFWYLIERPFMQPQRRAQVTAGVAAILSAPAHVFRTFRSTRSDDGELREVERFVGQPRRG